MTDIIAAFRAHAKGIEDKYASRQPLAGASKEEMIAQLEQIRDKMPDIEKDLLDLANYLVAEYDAEVTDELQLQLKEEFVEALKRIVSSYAIN